jgi:hypothetical protein
MVLSICQMKLSNAGHGALWMISCSSRALHTAPTTRVGIDQSWHVLHTCLITSQVILVSLEEHGQLRCEPNRMQLHSAPQPCCCCPSGLSSANICGSFLMMYSKGQMERPEELQMCKGFMHDTWLGGTALRSRSVVKRAKNDNKP